MRHRWYVPALGLAGVVAVGVLLPGLVRSLPNEPRQMSSEKAPVVPEPPPPVSASPRLKGPPRPSSPGADPPDRKQRGVSLGLFAEDVSFDYAPLLKEIAELGASHVALVVPIYQEHGGSTRLALHTRLSPSLVATAETVRAARRAGLEVMLFPIIRLSAPRNPSEWRGTLAPRERGRLVRELSRHPR